MQQLSLWITFLVVILYLIVVNGSNASLSCYACSLKYSRTRNTNSCVSHLTNDFIQRCSANQKYCEVKYSLTYGNVKSIERGCATNCLTSCKNILFGIRKEKCSRCCDEYLCNDDDVASNAGITNPKLIAYIIYILLLLL